MFFTRRETNKLKAIQVKMVNGDVCDQNFQIEKDYHTNLANILKKEELFQKKKSKIKWLKKGEHNSFHILALNLHTKRNQIKNLKDDLGIEGTTLSHIGFMASTYFQHSFYALSINPTTTLDDHLFDNTPSILTNIDSVSIFSGMSLLMKSSWLFLE